MALTIEITSSDGTSVRQRLQPDLNRIAVRIGDSYRIFDDQDRFSPTGVTVRRVDNDLLVEHLAGTGSADEASLELPGYYTLCSSSSPCQLTIQPGSGVDAIRVDALTAPIGALPDGSFILYDPGFDPSTLSGAGDSVPVRPILYGLGGLAVVGLAAGGGGGGGDGPTAVSGSGGSRAADSTLKVTSLPFVNTRTPVITGEGEPGARIVVQLDSDDDGRADVGYATTVGSDFRWRIDLASDVPVQGALPPQGLPDTSSVLVSQSINGGSFQSLPLYPLTFDDTPPARAVINPGAGDNIVPGP